jgi:hypothetical protein
MSEKLELAATAPRDGRWAILRFEYQPPCIGRFNPKHCPGLGTYEWEVFLHGEWDNYADGRLTGWSALPAALVAQP